MIFSHLVILPYNLEISLGYLNLLLEVMDLTFHEKIQYNFLSLLLLDGTIPPLLCH